MYNLSYYKEEDHEEVKQFMIQNPFAMLIGVDADQKPVATQIPILIEERDGKLFLMGHVMRKSDHQLAFEKNSNALVIFTGPHTYVSASWYSNQQTASTWNYIAVHARGNLNFLGDNILLEILKRTTATFENNVHSPSLFENLPEDYVSKMAKGIIAFEIEVKEIANVFKLSQNRDAQSHENIINKLNDRGDADSIAIAKEMSKRKIKS
ncbi:MAG: protease [Bacteroidetes bacterium]|nr:MAG: protease [Bacteroidota bacterium]